MRGGFAGTEETGQVEGLAFHDHALEAGNIRKSKMSAVSGKHNNVFTFRDRSGPGLETTDEEIIEGTEGVGGFQEFSGIDAVSLNERLDFCTAARFVHAPSIPTRKPCPSGNRPQEELTQDTAIGPAKPSLTIDFFRPDCSGHSVEILDGRFFHACWSFLQKMQSHACQTFRSNLLWLTVFLNCRLC